MSPMIQIEFWQFVAGAFMLLCTFVSVSWLFGVILVRQFKGHLDSKLSTMEAARSAADAAMQAELQRHSAEEGKALDQLKLLERDFQNWRAELPINYVRREDYIRGQSVIEAKIDALFSEFKLLLWQINKGNKQ